MGSVDVLVEAADRVQERLRVRVDRLGEQLARATSLDDAAGVHHMDVVAEAGGEPEVVGDEDHRHVPFLDQARQQVMIRACVVTSSAVVGSSAIRTSGPAEIAIAIITR